MVQDQLVDYINAQMKLGVSRDAIKTTLTGAGWQAIDVEDTLKKIESTKMAQPIAAMPAGSVSAKPAEPAFASRLASAGATSVQPQTIKVSDLVSASPSSSMPATAKSPMTGPMPGGMAASSGTAKSSNVYQASTSSVDKPRRSRGALITEIILILIIIAVGGFAGFLYMQNTTLTAQLGTLTGQSSGVNSQLSTLQAQVAASTTALTAQVASLNTNVKELQAELAFYAPPAGIVPGATSSVAISGVVSGGGKALYVITATYGAKIYIANSKIAGIIAALTPLLGTATASTTTSTSTTATTSPAIAQFSGTYIPGSDSLTLTAVNGTAVQ